MTNAGVAVHFYVGTEEEQMAHDAEMAGMDHDADPTEDALTLDPGETDELTVAFDEAGEILYGCHQPGHYVRRHGRNHQGWLTTGTVPAR